MGTRHLTIVSLDQQYRVAQYGQWDGYPEGQGATVLEFLQTWDRPAFEAKLRASSYMSPDDFKALDAEIKAMGREQSWSKYYPALTRDTGAKILDLVAKSEPGLKLKNSISFAGDSLFCEWAYLLDLDANVLEVYRGFQKSPLPETERFAKYPALEKNDGYFPIRKVASYSLSDLPTVDKMTDDVTEKEDA